MDYNNRFMKYIPAEKLTKSIEDKGLDCSFALKMERLDTLALIDKLQQEQPEVDLEKEIAEWQGYEAFPEGTNITPLPKAMNIVEKTAKHFYELGLNARNENIVI